MKILKLGTIEQRKFVCSWCECEFVVGRPEMELTTNYSISCPCCRNRRVWWDEGELYEESKSTDRERLAKLFNEGKDKTNFIDFLLDNGVGFV